MLADETQAEAWKCLHGWACHLACVISIRRTFLESPLAPRGWETCKQGCSSWLTDRKQEVELPGCHHLRQGHLLSLGQITPSQPAVRNGYCFKQLSFEAVCYAAMLSLQTNWSMSEFRLWVSVPPEKPFRAPVEKGDLLSGWSHLPSQAQAETAPPTAPESWWQNSAQGLARSHTNDMGFSSFPNYLIPYHSQTLKYLRLFTLSPVIKIQKSFNTWYLNTQWVH